MAKAMSRGYCFAAFESAVPPTKVGGFKVGDFILKTASSPDGGSVAAPWVQLTFLLHVRPVVF